MTKKIAAASFLSAALLSPACFGLGLPSFGGAGSASSESSAGSADVDTFLKQGKASAELINNSRDMLVKAISSKEDRAKLQAQLDQIHKGLAANDKKAAEDLQKYNADADAKLAAAANDKAAQDNLKNLSKDQKAAVAKAFGNLALGVLMQTQQLQTGQNLVKSAAGNFALASKLPDLKDAVSDMGSNVKTGAELVSKLPGLFKSANIEVVAPKDATTKPEAVDPNIFG